MTHLCHRYVCHKNRIQAIYGFTHLKSLISRRLYKIQKYKYTLLSIMMQTKLITAAVNDANKLIQLILMFCVLARTTVTATLYTITPIIAAITRQIYNENQINTKCY